VERVMMLTIISRTAVRVVVGLETLQLAAAAARAGQLHRIAIQKTSRSHLAVVEILF
jgi:hypothetical protein